MAENNCACKRRKIGEDGFYAAVSEVAVEGRKRAV
jgi:hypothetical protein